MDIASRPYTIVTGRIPINTTSGISLVDSRGVGLKCNNFEIMATDPSGTTTELSSGSGWYTVELSSTTNGVNKVGSGINYNGLSGIIGKSAHLTQPLEILVAGADSCSSLNITNRTGNGVRFIINYGNTTSQNVLRGTLGNLGS